MALKKQVLITVGAWRVLLLAGEHGAEPTMWGLRVDTWIEDHLRQRERALSHGTILPGDYFNTTSDVPTTFDPLFIMSMYMNGEYVNPDSYLLVRVSSLPYAQLLARWRLRLLSCLQQLEAEEQKVAARMLSLGTLIKTTTYPSQVVTYNASVALSLAREEHEAEQRQAERIERGYLTRLQRMEAVMRQEVEATWKA